MMNEKLYLLRLLEDKSSFVKKTIFFNKNWKYKKNLIQTITKYYNSI